MTGEARERLDMDRQERLVFVLAFVRRKLDVDRKRLVLVSRARAGVGVPARPPAC